MQRHGDRCLLNRGNTPGEYCIVRSTPVHDAPDGNDKQDKSWWETVKEKAAGAADWVGDKAAAAGHAAGQWIEDHPRTMGAVQAAGGVAEAIGSGALFAGGTAADATGVGAIGGVPAQIVGGAGMVNAADNISTGLRQIWYGRPQQTAAVQATGAAARALGATPGQTQVAQEVVSGGQIVLGGVAGAGGALAKTGQGLSGEIAAGSAAAKAEGRAAASAGDDLAEAEASAARNAEQPGVQRASEDGSAGARSTRKLSLRERYLGKTPGKKSKTGKAVIARMKKDG
ncbi:hypothetical protein J1C48_18710, partial [Jiella sp. CQZ9-1]|nr:hypothetical protein [Jiella flava]